MVTLYLMKEKNEMINFIGIACGDNLEIDNDKKEVKMHIKGEIASIIKQACAKIDVLLQFGKYLNQDFIDAGNTFYQEFMGVEGSETDEEIATQIITHIPNGVGQIPQSEQSSFLSYAIAYVENLSVLNVIVFGLLSKSCKTVHSPLWFLTM